MLFRQENGGEWKKVVVDVKVTSTDKMNDAFKEKDEKYREWTYSRMSRIFPLNPHFQEKSGLIVKMAISLKLLRFPLKIWEIPKVAVSQFSGPSDSPITTFQSELFGVMDNTLRVVQERLRLQEERRQQILEAGQ